MTCTTGAAAPSTSTTPAEEAPRRATSGMVVRRDRLHGLIAARLPGAVWLHGPTGAGKTVVLRTWLQQQRCPSIWLSADERHRDPAALFAALGATAAPHCGATLPVFSPEHRDDPGAFARRYFSRLHAALPDRCAVVVDDAHHLAGATAPLLAHAIDAFDDHRMLCFASQLLPEACFAAQVAGSRLSIVGHRLLAFDRDEARDLADRIGTVVPSVEALVRATDGWAAGLMLAMQFGTSGGSDDASSDPLERVRTPLAMLIAGHALGGVARGDLTRLRLLAELPQVPMELAEVAPDWGPACAHLQALSERGLFVERLAVDRRPPSGDVPGRNVMRLAKGCWQLHDLFRNALREPASIGAPDLAVGALLADHLLALDRLDLAWQLAAGLDAALLARVVASHGAAALRSVHLSSMLQLAQPHAHRAAPGIAIWQARALIGNDYEAALEACEEAHAGYEALADEAGVALAVSLALFVVFATIENVGAIAAWTARFEAVARFPAEGPDDRAGDGAGQALRVAGEVVHDLLVGSRSTDRRAEGALQDCLMAHVVGEVLSANETTLAGSLLVAAMRRAHRMHEVELAIVRVAGLSSFRRSAPHIRANWNIENAYNFMRFAQPERAHDALDEALAIAGEHALLQTRIAALIGLVRLELARGDLQRGQHHLAVLDGIGQERLARQHGWVVHLRSRAQMLAGHAAAAVASIDRAERLILEAGFPQSARVILDQDRMQMMYADGDVDESLALAQRVIAYGSQPDGRRVELTRGLLQAHRLWYDDRPRAEALLREHLGAAEALGLIAFLPLLPQVAAGIAAHALRLGIAQRLVTDAIRTRRLPAPRDAPGNWPWPVRIEVLRPFCIYRSGAAQTFSGKAQQKPLELLKYLACQRDLMAESSTVALALWPDAEDGAAKKSLEVTISRLRKLLEDDTLLVVREGKVALDARAATSDAREFTDVVLAAEALPSRRQVPARVVEIGDHLLRLFGELPLEHEEPTAWREAVRERARNAFVRAVRSLVDYWSEAGDASRATTLIEAAVAREPLAESLYRALMQIHVDAGNRSEALRVYRQCRQMLSVLIGARPTAETERLKNSINLHGSTP